MLKELNKKIIIITNWKTFCLHGLYKSTSGPQGLATIWWLTWLKKAVRPGDASIVELAGWSVKWLMRERGGVVWQTPWWSTYDSGHNAGDTRLHPSDIPVLNASLIHPRQVRVSQWCHQQTSDACPAAAASWMGDTLWRHRCASSAAAGELSAGAIRNTNRRAKRAARVIVDVVTTEFQPGYLVRANTCT